MTERKWTPGPWEVSGYNGRVLSHWDGIGYWEIENAVETSFKGESGAMYRTYGSRTANAHLIAAAPDLYEALEWALSEIEGRTRYTDDAQRENCMDISRSALAKARGEA